MAMSNVLNADFASQPEQFCKYIHRYCNQTRLEGFDYCIRHILEDKTAPFKQCMYINPTNKKRCTNAAPKPDKKDKKEHVLCPFHVKQASVKPRTSVPRKNPVTKGPAAVLKYLEHHCIDSQHDPNYTREAGEAEKYQYAPCVGGRPSSLEEIEASLGKEQPVIVKTYADDVDDDFNWVEKPSDLLEHAGVYTHKEILQIAREKTLQLQQLYIEELRIIYQQLRENRRKFLNSVANQDPNQAGPSEPVDPEMLDALKKYHRCSRAEKLMRHRFVEKLSVKKSKAKQCAYEKNGSKCTSDALVLTDFCKNHILSDKKQVLYRPCGLKRNCQKPVIPYQAEAACDLHFHLALGKSILTEPEVQPPEEPAAEPEHFQSMDDIASLGLDAIIPGSLFGLDQFGEPGESDIAIPEDLMKVQPITLNLPADILDG